MDTGDKKRLDMIIGNLRIIAFVLFVIMLSQIGICSNSAGASERITISGHTFEVVLNSVPILGNYSGTFEAYYIADIFIVDTIIISHDTIGWTPILRFEYIGRGMEEKPNPFRGVIIDSIPDGFCFDNHYPKLGLYHHKYQKKNDPDTGRRIVDSIKVSHKEMIRQTYQNIELWEPNPDTGRVIEVWEECGLTDIRIGDSVGSRCEDGILIHDLFCKVRYRITCHEEPDTTWLHLWDNNRRYSTVWDIDTIQVCDTTEVK